MKTAMLVVAVMMAAGAAVADSLTYRLDGVAGHTQQTIFATDCEYEVWGFDIAGTPTWRLGKKVAEIGSCPVKVLGKVRDGQYGIQAEVGIAKMIGNTRINGCLGATLPVLDNDACLYSPGVSTSVPAGKRVRAGVAMTYSWPSGAEFQWNAGPEVSVKVNDRVTINYRNTFLGNGAQEDQLKATLSW